MVNRPERKNRNYLLLLLLLPFIVLLIPPIYNYDQPELIGVPFFYWFQLLVIVLTAILTAALYFGGA
jgi:polyferredoxin